MRGNACAGSPRSAVNPIAPPGKDPLAGLDDPDDDPIGHLRDADSPRPRR